MALVTALAATSCASMIGADWDSYQAPEGTGGGSGASGGASGEAGTGGASDASAQDAAGAGGAGAGGAGDAATNDAANDVTSDAAAVSGGEIVASGTTAEADGYTLVFTVGASTLGVARMEADGWVLQGGLVGSTGSVP
jgi:hypothetical protein